MLAQQFLELPIFFCQLVVFSAQCDMVEAQLLIFRVSIFPREDLFL